VSGKNDIQLQGLKEALKRNQARIAALRPRGALGQAVQHGVLVACVTCFRLSMSIQALYGPASGRKFGVYGASFALTQWREISTATGWPSTRSMSMSEAGAMRFTPEPPMVARVALFCAVWPVWHYEGW